MVPTELKAREVPSISRYGEDGWRSLTVAQLSYSNEACHILVEYLESAAVFFGLAGLAEATRAVQHLEEGLEID